MKKLLISAAFILVGFMAQEAYSEKTACLIQNVPSNQAEYACKNACQEKYHKPPRSTLFRSDSSCASGVLCSCSY